MDQLEIVRRCYAGWNAGDLRHALAYIDPGVHWRTSGVFPGLEPLYVGHDGLLRWQADLRTPFSSFTVTVLDAELEGDVVHARVRFDAVGETSGAPVQLHFVNRWHFREGVIVSFDSRPLD